MKLLKIIRKILYKKTIIDCINNNKQFPNNIKRFILKDAIDYLNKNRGGMCTALHMTILNYSCRNVPYNDLCIFIPSFNRQYFNEIADKKILYT